MTVASYVEQWVGVKWVLFIRGARSEVLLENGRVKEGPKWARGKMIDKVLETVKRQGGSAFCAGVATTGKVVRTSRKSSLTTAPREISKQSMIRSRM